MLKGILLFIIGLAVAITSANIGTKFQIFFWIGCIFMVIGAFKALTKFILRKPQKKLEKAMLRQAYPNLVHCRKCAASCYSTANYCHMCGTSLR